MTKELCLRVGLVVWGQVGHHAPVVRVDELGQQQRGRPQGTRLFNRDDLITEV